MKQRRSACSILVCVTLSACATAPIPLHLLGTPASPDRAERTVVISPATRHVHVEGGEIVRFVSASGEFSWHFNVAPRLVDSFSLNRVAPAGVLGQPVQAYVAPDPRYWNIP